MSASDIAGLIFASSWLIFMLALSACLIYKVIIKKDD
jgi:hypothetical protein